MAQVLEHCYANRFDLPLQTYLTDSKIFPSGSVSKTLECFMNYPCPMKRFTRFLLKLICLIMVKILLPMNSCFLIGPWQMDYQALGVALFSSTFFVFVLVILPLFFSVF